MGHGLHGRRSRIHGAGKEVYQTWMVISARLEKYMDDNV